MAFPSTPEQLSSNWLSTHLSTHLGCAVDDFRVELFGEGASIMGMVTRLHLHTPQGTTTVIAKFPSPSAENRAVAATYDMYGRETFFYQHIAPTISLPALIRVPDCYHAEFDATDQSFVILMEDLQDWRIGDQVAGCNQAEAATVIRGIAALHASSWQSSLDIVSHNNPAQRDGMMAGFTAGWPVVNGQFADLIPHAAQNLGSSVVGKVAGLLEQMCQEPVCISHADVRLDNIFFKQEQIALVDWQSVCISAPEQDLAYFVTQSLTTDVRQAEDWVALYHDSLLHHGVRDYSLQQCRERFRVCAAYLLCYAVTIAGTLDMGNKRGLALARTLFGNTMQSLEELDAFTLLR